MMGPQLVVVGHNDAAGERKLLLVVAFVCQVVGDLDLMNFG